MYLHVIFKPNRGVALIITFLMMILLAGIALAAGVYSRNSLRTGRSQLFDKQAFYVAEAGIQRARQALVDGVWSAAASPGNTETEHFGAGEYSVSMIDQLNGMYTISSVAYLPNSITPIAKRKISLIDAVIDTGVHNLSLSALASASSSSGSNMPDKAIDGASVTRWQAGTKGSNQWLQLDYGVPTTHNQIIVYERSDIDGISAQSSADGMIWETMSGLSAVESPAKTWTLSYNSITEQYVRVIFTSVPSNKHAQVEELESYNSDSDSFSFVNDGVFTTEW